MAIQVKTLSKKDPVPLGKSLEKIMGDFWIVINNISIEPRAFVLLPSEVKERAHRGVKDGKESFWLQPKEYQNDQFREAWQRIGFGHSDRELPVNATDPQDLPG